MRRLMTDKTAAAAWPRLAAILLVLISATAALAQSGGLRPLPPQIVSKAPGIRPFGSGRHTYWGIRMYDATLWIVGPQWSPATPHALDLEPGRAVPSDTLVKNAISEMRDLKVGNDQQLRTWQGELKQLIPDVKQGDQVVIFCSPSNRTFVYLNNSSTGSVDDPSFCPALMSVWLHPQTKHQTVRRSLLGH